MCTMFTLKPCCHAHTQAILPCSQFEITWHLLTCLGLSCIWYWQSATTRGMRSRDEHAQGLQPDSTCARIENISPARISHDDHRCEVHIEF